MTELEAKSKLLDETDDRVIGLLMNEREKLKSLKESKQVRAKPVVYFILALLVIYFASFLMPKYDVNSNLISFKFT